MVLYSTQVYCVSVNIKNKHTIGIHKISLVVKSEVARSCVEGLSCSVLYNKETIAFNRKVKGIVGSLRTCGGKHCIYCSNTYTKTYLLWIYSTKVDICSAGRFQSLVEYVLKCNPSRFVCHRIYISYVITYYVHFNLMVL